MSTPTPTPEIDWPGLSGQNYRYWVHPLPFNCDSKHDGNYVFTKLVGKFWIPIYVGQGNLNVRCNDAEHLGCAMGKGATHVHVHTSASEADRVAEERDILAKFPNAYAPVGCNQKAHG